MENAVIDVDDVSSESSSCRCVDVDHLPEALCLKMTAVGVARESKRRKKSLVYSEFFKDLGPGSLDEIFQWPKQVLGKLSTFQRQNAADDPPSETPAASGAQGDAMVGGLTF
ncbi:hypothetical protein AK812_SmicGene43625 [Symbiodinium microadriaticum]|uniref:Uncharacterized protein n=1 Tax=Symbiodinium microadriaticum TaxID=2951 RepID=A0A1Q9C0L6_SYMMI|nr:hypothetical protein AK812_SmicGene43625 [Symbiodinium microadriaticum]